MKELTWAPCQLKVTATEDEQGRHYTIIETVPATIVQLIVSKLGTKPDHSTHATFEAAVKRTQELQKWFIVDEPAWRKKLWDGRGFGKKGESSK